MKPVADRQRRPAHAVAKSAPTEDDCLARIGEVTLVVKQSVFRNGSTTMFLRNEGPKFKCETPSGLLVEGSIDSGVGMPSIIVFAKWVRDADAQYASFVVNAADVAEAVVRLIDEKLVEERHPANAKDSRIG